MKPITAVSVKVLALTGAILTLSATTQAVDGVKLIDMAAAAAGGVTPGDEPGFPVTISRRGSYRLASDLNVPPNTTAIEITIADVTLDLNGFVIRVLRGRVVPTTGYGVFADPGSVTVMNGTITGMGYKGIEVGPNSRI